MEDSDAAGLPGSCMPLDSARHVSPTGQTMTSVSVLLVEDNEDNRTIYTTILRHCGHEVAEAGTGEEGIRLARELRPGVILMDVAMPGIDGWEATRRLKADPITAHIPVIALTAHAMAEDRLRATEAGCESYLAKPIEPRRVVEEVEKLLARVAAAAAESAEAPAAAVE
jgi:two-component system cell cycle response regulator DivK